MKVLMSGINMAQRMIEHKSLPAALKRQLGQAFMSVKNVEDV
jgi:hypothetical protein